MEVSEATMNQINKDALAIIDEFVFKAQPDTNRIISKAREIGRLSSCRNVATEGKVCKTK